MKKNNINMTDTKHTEYMFSNRNLLKLIIPLVIEQFLAMAVGMADTIMVASVGEAAVSAVSLVDTVNVLIINIFAAVATGGAVVCSQFLGRCQSKRACIAADQLLLFTLGLAVLLMGIIYLGRDWILSGIFGKIEPEVHRNANLYLLIVAASIPFIALYNSGAALFRAMGNSKVSMMVSLLMNGINVAGNALLVYGFKCGVEGVAIPTLVSRVVAAAVIYGMSRNPQLTVHTSARFVLRPQWSFIKKIMYIGIPSGLENSMFQLGKILVLSLVSSFGTASIAANAVANNIAAFQLLPGVAVGLALVTVSSRCVGAGDYQQVRYYTRKLLGVVYVSMILINLLIILLLPIILRIYNLSDDTYLYALQLGRYHGVVCCILWPLSFTFVNTLRAANDVKYAMLVSMLSMWIFRIGFSYLLAGYMKMGLLGVWVAMTVDWLVRSVFFLIRYLGHKWELHKI